MPESLAAFQQLKYNNKDKFETLQNDVRDEKVRELIRTEYPLTIHADKQGKHIRGSKTFIEGKSEIYLSVEECQKVLDEYALTGEYLYDSNGKWREKELIKTDKVLGCAVDKEKNMYETHWAIIHYSGTGTHIVPRREI